MKTGATAFEALVHRVENQEDYIYFGFFPDDPRNGSFGYARLYESGSRKFGVIKKMELI
jgi:hypothetical protein